MPWPAVRSVREGELDRTLQPEKPLDILAQQIVAACVQETWDEEELYTLFHGSWSNSSDRRLKKNINDLEGSLDNLLALRGVTYEYKDPEAINELPGERIGMIAQEVEEVFPDWVSEGGHGYKTLTFRGFEALAVEALRELREEKDAQIASLENRVAQLEAMVAQIAAHQGVEQ